MRSPGPAKARRQAKKRPEFAALTRYIFPGGELDYLWRTVADLEGHGFEVRDVEGWREHYQRTCRMWHDRLLARYDEACGEVGETTTRVWLVYLGVFAGLRARRLRHLPDAVVCKRARGASGLPPTRADLYRLQRPGNRYGARTYAEVHCADSSRGAVVRSAGELYVAARPSEAATLS